MKEPVPPWKLCSMWNVSGAEESVGRSFSFHLEYKVPPQVVRMQAF